MKMKRNIALAAFGVTLGAVLILTHAGYTTLTASTGEEASMKAQQSPPDLIILDLLLPEANGLALCEQLRRHRATASVPIIIVTGLPGELTRFAGIEAGADAYVRKPFDGQEIVSRIDALLYQSKESPSASRRRDSGAAGRISERALVPDSGVKKA